MFNGSRSPANLNNFNKPVNPGIIAMGGTITQDPQNPRKNYITNPSFQVNTSGWNISDSVVASTSSTVSKFGTQSLKFNTSSLSRVVASCSVAVNGTAGDYTFSIYTKVPQTGGYSYCVQTSYTASGTPYCSQYATVTSTLITAQLILRYADGSSVNRMAAYTATNNISQRVYITATAVQDVVSADMFLHFSDIHSASDIYIDGGLLEKSSVVQDYFDGGSSGYHWDGIEHLSTSSQNTYNVHTFTSDGAFDVLQLGTSYNTVDYLIVAGGGPSGANGGGGGGAGGLLSGSANIGATTYSVSVGSGGIAATYNGSYPVLGTNGSNSSALGLTAIGGGAGGSTNGSVTTYNQGQNGGSGGGSGNGWTELFGGSGIPGQGNNGGASVAVWV